MNNGSGRSKQVVSCVNTPTFPLRTSSPMIMQAAVWMVLRSRSSTEEDAIDGDICPRLALPGRCSTGGRAGYRTGRVDLEIIDGARAQVAPASSYLQFHDAFLHAVVGTEEHEVSS